MMGVAESDINWAWFTGFAALHFFTAIGSGLMTSALYSNSSLSILIIFWILAWLAVIPFCMFMAAFFSKATRATLVSLLVFFAGEFRSRFLCCFFETDQTKTGLLPRRIFFDFDHKFR